MQIRCFSRPKMPVGVLGRCQVCSGRAVDSRSQKPQRLGHPSGLQWLQGTPKPSPQSPAMQDADCAEGSTSHPPRRLVCHDRPRGCIFSDPNMGGTQALPQVHLQRQNLQVPCPSIWHVTSSPYVHKVHQCSPFVGKAFASSITWMTGWCALARRSSAAMM